MQMTNDQRRMIQPSESETAARLKRALNAFQKAQELMLTAHRKLKGAPAEATDQFWRGTGARLEQHQRACAIEVVEAYRAFSVVGSVAGAHARRLVNEAHQHLHPDNTRPVGIPQVERDRRREEWRECERLRDLIEHDLERRGTDDAEEISVLMDCSPTDVSFLYRRSWREGDLARLQRAAERMGLLS